MQPSLRSGESSLLTNRSVNNLMTRRTGEHAVNNINLLTSNTVTQLIFERTIFLPALLFSILFREIVKYCKQLLQRRFAWMKVLLFWTRSIFSQCYQWRYIDQSTNSDCLFTCKWLSYCLLRQNRKSVNKLRLFRVWPEGITIMTKLHYFETHWEDKNSPR